MSTIAWKMRDHVLKSLKESEASFKDENEDALEYKVIPQIKVVRKVPPELHGVPARLVKAFISSNATLYSTNEQIMETVSGWVFKYRFPSNYMDKPLSRKQLTAIEEIMAGNNLSFDKKVHNSLSKLKLAVQAGKSASEAEVIYNGHIAFGRDYIVVGAKRFPFTPDADYHRVKVGSQKLRVDVLRALLEAGNLPSSTS
jgi:hypothetical protein